jgi:hypothetical protein
MREDAILKDGPLGCTITGIHPAATFALIPNPRNLKEVYRYDVIPETEKARYNALVGNEVFIPLRQFKYTNVKPNPFGFLYN